MVRSLPKGTRELWSRESLGDKGSDSRRSDPVISGPLGDLGERDLDTSTTSFYNGFAVPKPDPGQRATCLSVSHSVAPDGPFFPN